MKNIVVLDAHTLSPLQPGEHSPFHPDWDALSDLGPVQLFPRTPVEQVIERAREAQVLLTNKAVVNADHIAALPKLEYIGVMATGYNVVDLAATRARGIPVTNIPGYSTMSVAQHVFALLLELAARAGASDAAVKNGDWVRCPDFCFTVAPFFEVAGKTLGIVGYGTIGQAVARIGAALGMKIIVTSRSQRPSETPVEWVTQEELFAQSDVITLHCPLTDETRGMINQANIGKMKRSVYLINTGRGPLIDEAALASALNAGRIAGFGADVLSTEPPARDNPLLSARNTIITPHIAWASVEARTRLMGLLVENIRAFFAGTPTNIVNGAIAATNAIATTESTEPSPQETAASQPEPQPESQVVLTEATTSAPAALESAVEEAAESAVEPVAEASFEPAEESVPETTTEPISDSSGESHIEPSVEELPSDAAETHPAEPAASLASESSPEVPVEQNSDDSDTSADSSHPEQAPEIPAPLSRDEENAKEEHDYGSDDSQEVAEAVAELVSETNVEPVSESSAVSFIEPASESISELTNDSHGEFQAAESEPGQPDSVPAESLETSPEAPAEHDAVAASAPLDQSHAEQAIEIPEQLLPEEESAISAPYGGDDSQKVDEPVSESAPEIIAEPASVSAGESLIEPASAPASEVAGDSHGGLQESESPQESSEKLPVEEIASPSSESSTTIVAEPDATITTAPLDPSHAEQTLEISEERSSDEEEANPAPHQEGGEPQKY